MILRTLSVFDRLKVKQIPKTLINFRLFIQNLIYNIKYIF